ncbi:protein phosphatase 2C domain-containing protein [Candidatus Uhrbacteria bacterium]|nr:protein phosphatase 2C domain-containing protein [Candidatus Uhrbacteria bacterium]
MSHGFFADSKEWIADDSGVRERYLAFFEKQLGLLHEGPTPETGFIQKGILERKQVCEDVKLKQTKHGLFVVADGEDWLSSREAVRTMSQHLGEILDQQAKNVCDHSHPEETLDRLTRFVATVLKTSVLIADHRIHVAWLNAESEISGTTLSCGRLLSISDTTGDSLHRFFFLNLGNSRIYLCRKNRTFQKLTVDDTNLQQWVHEGKLTPEEFFQIDQALSPKHLPRKLFAYATHLNRFRLTRRLGRGEISENAPFVSFVDLQPGERIVMTTNGVSDQLLESEIQAHLFQHKNDHAAERSLQQAALERSLDGRHPRAIADDLSALVHTV